MHRQTRGCGARGKYKGPSSHSHSQFHRNKKEATRRMSQVTDSQLVTFCLFCGCSKPSWNYSEEILFPNKFPIQVWYESYSLKFSLHCILDQI